MCNAPCEPPAQRLSFTLDFRLVACQADGDKDGPPTRAGCTLAHSPPLEPGVLNKSLTVVLPVYNGETRLRKSVHEILELASELTSKFGVLIIDDGSNDATYEVAEELAARYPQVSVRRHRHRRGLGPTIDYVQRRVRSDAVIVHDGTTPIDAGEMRSLWKRWIHQSASQTDHPAKNSIQNEIRSLSNLSAIHKVMEKVHSRVLGFQMVTPIETTEPGVDLTAPAQYAAPAAERRNNIGQIPPLPRPKFLSALANFALGE
jgi:Glycosyl transferase family 2